MNVIARHEFAPLRELLLAPNGTAVVRELRESAAGEAGFLSQPKQPAAVRRAVNGLFHRICWPGVGVGAITSHRTATIRLRTRLSPLGRGLLLAKDHLRGGARQILRAGSLPIEIPVPVQARDPRVARRVEAEPGGRSDRNRGSLS